MKLQFYVDENNEWRRRLVARNGRIVADSGEGYRAKAGAVKGFLSVVRFIKASH